MGSVARDPPILIPTTLPHRRTHSLSRITNETKIQVSLSLDGGALLPFETSPHFPTHTTSISPLTIPLPESRHATQITHTQEIALDTSIGFLDHMLHALAKHAGWSLAVR